MKRLFLQTRQSITPTLLQIFGGRLQGFSAKSVRSQIVTMGYAGGAHGGSSYTLKKYGLGYLDYFDICQQLNRSRQIYRFDRHIAAACTFKPISAERIISSNKEDGMFSGSGATGTSILSLPDIPVRDKWALYKKKPEAMEKYKGPSDSGRLFIPSGKLLKSQVSQFLCLNINSIFPDTYNGLPSRREVIASAAEAFKLTPEIVAALLMTEQLDQSRNEDAADFQGAVSILNKDTSIGLGQVVVSTAQKHKLFSKLLKTTTTNKLSHSAVAYLLASDEFNIFAVANYIRIVADAGSKVNIKSVPKTKAAFPNINMPIYASHASLWPEDNIAALASEYTSTAWDDKLVGDWGVLTLITHGAVKSSKVPFK
ncbi:hypothetical protein N9M10_02685 [Hellea sp.]|nr:hypothetical protein [Hellea sp.]